MATLSREQTAQVLYQAGFRGDQLAQMVAIGGRESGYRPDAHRTDSPGKGTGDFGLFQINYTHVPVLQNAGIIQSSNDLFDPVKNAQAAFFLFKSDGMSPWGAAEGGFVKGGDPMYGTNLAAARTAVQNATNQGLLGQNYTGGTSMAAASNPNAASGPFTLPPDAQLFNNGMGLIAVFDVGGVKIGFDVTWWDGSVNTNDRPTTTVSGQDYANMGVVSGGNAEELRGFSTQWGNFNDFWQSTLDSVVGKTNPARNDPEVLRVIAEFAGRPDMSPQELNNKLQATQWYQSRTTGQLEWNGLADGEKQKRRDDAASRMVQTWFQFTGEALAPDDPRVQNYLEDIASGKMGYGKFTEDIVKKAATSNPESPWSRQTRAEGEDQRQRGVDVENTATRVKDLARKWGLNYSAGQFQDWAQQIVEKRVSEADVLEMFKDQSVVLYPWKDREMETSTAAMPWMQTYERVMEKPADLFEPQVQSALGSGTAVWDFEQQLKKSTGWLDTKNARDEMFSLVSEAGRRLGFE
jgi:hypothetical protein